MEKHFELATAAADGLVKMLPEDPEGWNHRSYALHEMKRTAEAQEKLRPAAAKFPDNWLVQYNACQLGEIEEARSFLERAIALGDANEVRVKTPCRVGSPLYPP